MLSQHVYGVTYLRRLLGQQDLQRDQNSVAETWTDRHPINKHLDVVDHNDAECTLVRVSECLIEVLYLLHLAKAYHVLG